MMLGGVPNTYMAIYFLLNTKIALSLNYMIKKEFCNTYSPYNCKDYRC